MNTTSANALAFAAIRQVFADQRTFTTTVGGRDVSVEVTAAPADAAGTRVDESRLPEGESWPQPVLARCRWEGGQCELLLRAVTYRNGGVGLSVRLHPRRRALVWIGMTTAIAASAATGSTSITAQYSTRKRCPSDEAKAAERRLNKQLARLMGASGLPLLQKSVLLFKIRTEDGQVEPSAAVALERLVRVALYKLDFLARRPDERERRGEPLVELAVPPAELDELWAGAGDDPDEDDSETPGGRDWALDVAPDGRPSGRRGLVAEGRWTLGDWTADVDAQATTAWSRLRGVSEGDRVAVKEVTESGVLRVRALGVVDVVDVAAGTIEFSPLKGALYEGDAAYGSSGGDWTGAILPVETRVDRERLFGAGADDADPAEGHDLPPNLILYGPPGTGKTYEVRQTLMPMFAADPGAGSAVDDDVLASLPWYQVIGAALQDLGGPVSVPEIAAHRWVRAKGAQRAIKAPIGARIWGNLQTHTVDESTTVSAKHRSGERVFDKDSDSRWFLVDSESSSIPEAFAALTGGHAGPPRHRFVTFHPSYGYEDFIEGIRPRTLERDDGSVELAYELEPGILMRAATEALRIAGFEGSMHDFCTDLSADERRAMLRNAPRYAVFIDEISRGNVARIFGELITLIEPTRRLGAGEELIATLPASNSRFGVPMNLHIVGTMNTADRSVEALDVALRRRFAFRECPPNPSLLDDVTVAGGVEVRRLLETINRRLQRLLDRDHQIGHAYFMPLRNDQSFDVLQGIFRDSIVPLLQEFFYGDWGRIGLVLGRAFVRRHDHRDVPFADFPHEDRDLLAQRATYELVDLNEITTEDFRAIYADDLAHA